jgi:hypothetical protein
MSSATTGKSTVRTHAERLGGPAGNTALTSAAGAVLMLLLAAEGVTILNLDLLRQPHMFIGMVLIPPVLVKLGSTGYRFVRYYAGARPYREKGAPLLGLRLLAPILVIATLAIFVTGVALLIAGHKAGILLEVHKVSFIVWAGVFVVHVLAHAPSMLRSLGSDWTATRRQEVAGSGLRLVLLLGAIAIGVMLALALLSPIAGWHGERHF